MWRTINKVLDKVPGSTTIMQIRDGSKTVSDSKQIASALRSNFVNVGPRLANRIEVKSGDDPLCHLHNRTEETVFQFKHANERTVLEYIQNLKPRKSDGPDKIPTTILKYSGDFIFKPLTIIFEAPQGWGPSKTDGKYHKMHHFINQVPKMIRITIGQFQSFQYYLSYAERLHMTNL